MAELAAGARGARQAGALACSRRHLRLRLRGPAATPHPDRRTLAAPRQRRRNGRGDQGAGDLLRHARAAWHRPSRDARRSGPPRARAGSPSGAAAPAAAMWCRAGCRRTQTTSTSRDWSRDARFRRCSSPMGVAAASSASASNGPRRRRAGAGAMAARCGPATLTKAAEAEMARAVARVVSAFGLKGLGSADFVLDGESALSAGDQPATRRHTRCLRRRGKTAAWSPCRRGDTRQAPPGKLGIRGSRGLGHRPCAEAPHCAAQHDLALLGGRPAKARRADRQTASDMHCTGPRRDQRACQAPRRDPKSQPAGQDLKICKGEQCEQEKERRKCSATDEAAEHQHASRTAGARHHR